MYGNLPGRSGRPSTPTHTTCAPSATDAALRRLTVDLPDPAHRLVDRARVCRVHPLEPRWLGAQTRARRPQDGGVRAVDAVGEVAILLFVVWHLIHFTIVKPVINVDGPDAAAIKGLALHDGRRVLPALVDGAPSTCSRSPLSACTSRTACSARSRRSASPRPPGARPGQGIQETSPLPWSSSASRSRPCPSSSCLVVRTHDRPDPRRHRGREDRRHQGPTRSPTTSMWEKRKMDAALVNLANRRKLSHVIIVGTGLAGGAAAPRRRGRLPRPVFCYQTVRVGPPDRRPGRHQRGQEPYCNDGDSVLPAVLRHGQGGDYRARARPTSTAWPRSARTSSTSASPRASRSPASTAVSSTTAPSVASRSPARSTPGPDGPAAADRRLPGAGAPGRGGTVEMFTRHEMLELIVVDGAPGIIARDLVTGEIETHLADAVVLASGGYGNVFFLSTNAMGSMSPPLAGAPQGAYFGNPATRRSTRPASRCPATTSRSSPAHVGVAAQRRPDLGAQEAPRTATRTRAHPRGGPRLLPGADLPGVRQPGPRDIASRQAKNMCDEGRGVGPMVGDFRRGRLPRLRRRDQAPGGRRPSRRSPLRQPLRHVRADHRENPYEVPMRIYPAVHYTMGGLWVDYDLQSTIPGCSRHRRGQLLRPRRQPLGPRPSDAGPGRRLLRPPEHHPRLPRQGPEAQGVRGRPGRREAAPRSRSAPSASLAIKASAASTPFHKELGHHVGVLRHGAHRGGLLKPSTSSVGCAPSSGATSRSSGRRTPQPEPREAGRVADFLELGELMCIDAPPPAESRGWTLPGGEPDRGW